jgi:hypothetical protein
MTRNEIKADILKRLEASATGMRSAEISDLYGMGNERRAGHLMESLKPAVMAMRFPRESRWVATSRAAEIKARVRAECRERSAKLLAERNALRRAQRAPREWTNGSDWTQPGPRVASVWDLAKVAA